MQKKTLWISGAAVAAVLVIGAATVAIADPFDNDSDGQRLTGQTLEQASDAALAEVGQGTVREAETSDDLDHAYEVEVRLDNGGETTVALDESFAVVWVDADKNGSNNNTGTNSGAGTDAATSNPAPSSAPSAPGVDADDVPLTEDERASATAAAIAAVGEGTITDLDRSDDADHAFEVEVTFADGRDTDVELAADFSVVKIDDDSVPAAQ